jgi:hypothetical protein
MDRQHSGRLRERNLLMGERGKGVGEEPNQASLSQASLLLYKSFNTLWY